MALKLNGHEGTLLHGMCVHADVGERDLDARSQCLGKGKNNVELLRQLRKQ